MATVLNYAALNEFERLVFDGRHSVIVAGNLKSTPSFMLIPVGKMDEGTLMKIRLFDYHVAGVWSTTRYGAECRWCEGYDAWRLVTGAAEAYRRYLDARDESGDVAWLEKLFALEDPRQ